MGFALLALDHAVDSVIASGGPLVPFAVVGTSGERSISRFPGDLEQGQENARSAVRSAANLSMAAVAWDGYVTVNERRTDAVFVEAFATGDAASVILAQRYERVGGLRKRFERVGNAAIVGSGAPLF